MHTSCLHVTAGNVGRKKYINMPKKIFLGHEKFLLLLDSSGLFGNSFQNAALGEKCFTNQTDSLKAYFAMITFTGVGGRGKREIREIWVYIISVDSDLSFCRCSIQCPEQVVNNLIKKIITKCTQDILTQRSFALLLPFYLALSFPYPSWLGFEIQFHLHGIIPACLTHAKDSFLEKNITSEVNIKWTSSENLSELPFAACIV